MEDSNYNQNNQNILEPGKIFSVSDYIKILNQELENFGTKIVGEVGQATIASSGHVYFTMKDEKDESVMNCIIWRHKYNLYNIDLKQGVKIIASGQPQIYSPTGNFSFICDVIEYAGEGILKKEYEKLKKQLTQEGVFEESKKRAIPKYLQKIGIITSRQGAVLADFLNNLGRFGFKIKMVDSRVEGQAAAQDLLLSIKTLEKQDIEALVIMRGGGSMESMQAFNNEILVREISNFPVPVIAAIGHDKDIPLAALAADCLVSTPSIAATLLGESWGQAEFLLEKSKTDIISSFQGILENANSLIIQSIDIINTIKDLVSNRCEEAEVAIKIFFQKFQNVLENGKIDIENLWDKFIFRFDLLLSKINQQLKYSDKIVYLNNPEQQLKLGYSIARCNNKVIRSVGDVKLGEDVDIRLKDGTVISKIKKVCKINK